jgi:hypothetical protein
MASHLVGLDLEDLTPRQLRMILRGAAKASMPSGKKSEKEKESDEEKEQEENDDLVDLHEEKGGKPKTPKVTKDDLPKGITKDEDEDEEEENS